MSQPNQSKYRRDPNEKRSKYIKDKNEKTYSSKYIRTDEEKEAYKEHLRKRKDEKPLSAKSRYEAYLERERLRNIAIEGEIFDGNDEIQTPEELNEFEVVNTVDNYEVNSVEIEETADEVEEAEEREYIRAKGASTDIFNTRRANAQDEINYRRAEKQVDKKAEIAIVVRLLWTAALTVLTVVLQFPIFRFRIPYTPTFLTMDFSLFPGMFAAIAYGPLTGVFIAIIKNLLFVAFNNTAVGTAASNIILDTLFLVLSSMIYSRGMFSRKRYEQNLRQLKATGKLKDNRRSRVFVSGTAASIVTSLVAILTINFIMFPIVYKLFGQYGYNAEYYVNSYERALQGIHRLLPFTQGMIPKIGSVERGVLMFNVPVRFATCFAATLVTTILYKPMSRILHYRPKTDKKK